MKLNVCPTCGRPYTPPDLLTPRQQDTLDALTVWALRSTNAVADALVVSYRAAYDHLRALEDMGYAHRPQGPRSGWQKTHKGVHAAHVA